MRGGLVEPIGKQSVPKPDGRGRPRSIDGVGVIGDGVETRTNCTSSCSINLFDVTDNLFFIGPPATRHGTLNCSYLAPGSPGFSSDDHSSQGDSCRSNFVIS